MSEIPPELSGLFSDKREVDIKQKIVDELLNFENHLETKTELKQPIRWSVLTVLEKMLNDKALLTSTTVLRRFTELAFTYLISNDRKGRLEYVEALKSFSNIIPNQNITQNPVKQLMER